MFIDALLAILHHLAVFALAALLAMEFAVARPGLSGRSLGFLAGIDRFYGGMAGAVVIIGVLRVIYGLKGWEFYVYSWTFWAKMAAIAVVGLLSIRPTMRILSWQREAQGNPGYVVPEGELAGIRGALHRQLAVFMLIPIFAALMARGIGS
jgi:putative membrane protein